MTAATTTSTKKRLEYPTVIILRHDRTKWNTGNEATSRLKGTEYDLPLTAEGLAKARQDALKLKGYDITSISTSAMIRSKQSAKSIADVSGVPAVSYSKFNPWDVGYLAGHTREEAKDRIVYYIEHPDRTVPEGESYSDFWDTFTSAIAKEMASAEKGDDDEYKPRVVITHSCGLLALEAFLTGSKPRPHVGSMPPPGSISAIEKRNGKWHLEFDWLSSGAPSKASAASAA